MKAVFDTNVLIAAFLTDGLCAKLLLRARRNEFSLILCPFILQEFQKFLQIKIKASNQEIEMAVNLLKEAASEINQPSFFSGLKGYAVTPMMITFSSALWRQNQTIGNRR